MSLTVAQSFKTAYELWLGLPDKGKKETDYHNNYINDSNDSGDCGEHQDEDVDVDNRGLLIDLHEEPNHHRLGAWVSTCLFFFDSAVNRIRCVWFSLKEEKYKNAAHPLILVYIF